MSHAGSLAETRACVFDAYGTLFDVHSAVRRHAGALGGAGDSLSATWRQKQLEWTWLRSLMGAHADFWAVTAAALDYAMERHGHDSVDLRQRLLDAYLELEPYPEVADTLTQLRATGRGLAVLSNGAPSMLAAAVANAGLQQTLDHVLSVEEVGIYKPDARVYQLACDRLGLPPSAICFLSSNGWDAHGAAHFGFQVVWINRFDQPAERLPGRPLAVIRTLDALPPLLAA
ncbi:MAG: haloacid dehalogenase type II [Pseudomonadota bacterium]